MSQHKIYSMNFARIYNLYLIKIEKKGRNQEELDEVITWLTGYDQIALRELVESDIIVEDFFKNAPIMNPLRSKITGLICGIRVEEVEESTMREIRYMDKLVDELAKGKSMDKILRK